MQIYLNGIEAYTDMNVYQGHKNYEPHALIPSFDLLLSVKLTLMCIHLKTNFVYAKIS